MNERIYELADRAGEYADFESGICTDEFLEKFAKLLVRECIGRIQLQQQMDETTADWIYNSLKSDLKDHFGVKE